MGDGHCAAAGAEIQNTGLTLFVFFTSSQYFFLPLQGTQQLIPGTCVPSSNERSLRGIDLDDATPDRNAEPTAKDAKDRKL